MSTRPTVVALFQSDVESAPASPVITPHPSSDNSEILNGDFSLEDPTGITGGLIDGNHASSAIRRKRRASLEVEDLAQLATYLGHEKRFKPAEQAFLSAFATKSERVQNVYIVAELMGIKQSVSKLSPADAVVPLKNTLKQLIDNICFAHLMDPNISGYLSDAVTEAENSLCKSPVFEPELKSDLATWKMILAQIKGRTTDFRYVIKKAIFESVYAPSPPKKQSRKKRGSRPAKGPSPPPEDNQEDSTPADLPKFVKLDVAKNLTDLTIAITKLCAANTNVKASLELAARIAFLRKVMIDNIGNDINYWDLVDEELETTREQAGNDPEKLWRGYRRIIKLDLDEHGSCDLPPSTTGKKY